jgi:hypothetical protein
MSKGWPGPVPGNFSFGCEDSLQESAIVRNTSDLPSRLMSPTVTMIAVAPAGGVLVEPMAAGPAARHLLTLAR